MRDLIEFALTIGNLKKTIRTGWKVAGINDPESVAEHSFRLAVICMVMADKFGVGASKLVKMALIDDLAEAVVGDIVYERGEEVFVDREEKLEQERKAIKEIFNNIEDGDEYLALWEESQKGKTREAQILKQLDKLEMAVQALEYEGEVESEKLDEFWINAKKHLKEPYLIELFDELSESRQEKKIKA